MATTAIATATTTPPVLHQLISLDTSLSQSLHTRFNPFIPGHLLLLLEYSADFRLFFPVSLSLYFAPFRRSFAIPFIAGLLIDLLFIGLVKSIFRRSRPHYNPNMIPAVSVDHFSFPSGHASRVFFIAAFASFFAVFESTSWFLLFVWTWALLTSVSRVFLGRHFVLDVLAGACLGVLEALFVFRFLRLSIVAVSFHKI
ncbi:hypothetical protein LWI29_022067 [Acer saccharum]|uniref:Phosphatidic acid phosphatase type 2/haloperoxidase domain-containing protein n=1 Tax=Acer saccharum TaxID=4024 RepID=A0AA39S8M6_ACESA|nr:hypothetical protein LWI29_022067 [Acer saccharum]